MVSDDKIPLLYFNAEKKQPEKKIRKLVLSDTFFIPKEVSAGWDKLKQRIEIGEDLKFNLSKRIHKFDYKDPMLNDWGVHHFHLNEKPSGEFIHGTELLVFALLVDDVFYAIGVYNHNSWADQDIVETMHRNWPTVLEGYKLTIIETKNQFTETERLKLRKATVNSFVTVKDGTIYAPIGGGVSGSGFGTQSVMRMIHHKQMLNNFEESLDGALEGLRSDSEANGYKGEPEVEAHLEITETQYKAIFPKYEISVILKSKMANYFTQLLVCNTLYSLSSS